MFLPSYNEVPSGYVHTVQPATNQAVSVPATYASLTALNASGFIQTIPSPGGVNLRVQNEVTIPGMVWFGFGATTPFNPERREAFSVSMSAYMVANLQFHLAPFIGVMDQPGGIGAPPEALPNGLTVFRVCSMLQPTAQVSDANFSHSSFRGVVRAAQVPSSHSQLVAGFLAFSSVSQSLVISRARVSVDLTRWDAPDYALHRPVQ